MRFDFPGLLKIASVGFVVTLVSIGLLSCAEDVANRYYGTERYPAKNPSDVELLRSAPGRPFVVIADLQSRGESPEAMRRRAAAIGADAVIVTPVGGFANPSAQWAGENSMSQTYTRLIGSALKYK